MLSGALLATAGCVSDRDDPGSAPSSKGVIDEPATLTPLKLSEEPLWSNDDVPGMTVVTYAAIHGDSALVVGGDDVRAADQVTVVDAATGKTRWTIDGRSEAALRGGGDAALWSSYDSIAPRMVGEGDDSSVIVEYIQPGERLGLAALSSKDGRVRWKSSSYAEFDATKVTVVDVDDEIAVVELGNRGSHSVTTIAIDVSNGRKVWEAPGVRPHGISDGAVLAGGILRGGIPEGEVVALDTKTGKRLWDLSEEYPSSAVVLVAGNATVVKVIGRASAPETMKTLVVETASGDTLAELKKADDRCQSDRRTLIACETTDIEHFVTYRFKDRTAGISAHKTPGQFVDGVWGGRVFMTPTGGLGGTSYDRSGNPIDENLPGELAMITDRYAAYHTNPREMEARGLVVHRRLT